MDASGVRTRLRHSARSRDASFVVGVEPRRWRSAGAPLSRAPCSRLALRGVPITLPPSRVIHAAGRTISDGRSVAQPARGTVFRYLAEAASFHYWNERWEAKQCLHLSFDAAVASVL